MIRVIGSEKKGHGLETWQNNMKDIINAAITAAMQLCQTLDFKVAVWESPDLKTWAAYTLQSWNFQTKEAQVKELLRCLVDMIAEKSLKKGELYCTRTSKVV